MELINYLNKNNINKLELIDKKGQVFRCSKEDVFKKFTIQELSDYQINYLCKNSKSELLDYKHLNCRIEPGALIRDKVVLKDNVVVMMGAIINIGAYIAENTMIDMGAVIGSKVQIGKNCHISAGAVIAGVIEPIAKKEVVIGDNVFIGANAVVCEGVRIGENSIIGAGSIVTKDIPDNVLAYGNPAKVIKIIDDELRDKININLKIR